MPAPVDACLDAALLDATLAGEPVDVLDARGVPFAFSSGHGPSGLPEGFRDRPLLGKPFNAEALLALIRTLLEPTEGPRLQDRSSGSRVLSRAERASR
jgi:hypothetical protein